MNIVPLLLTTNALGAGGGWTADYYVDSLAGDDGNDGLSIATAFATLGAAQTAAQSLGDGAKVGLVAGSVWREEFSTSGLDGIEVRGVGDLVNDGLPEIRCDDVVTGWTEVGGRTDVWTATMPVSTITTNTKYLMWKDDVELDVLASIDAVEAGGAGSVFCDTSGANPIWYIKASADPDGDGSVYEATARLNAINIANSGIDSVGSKIIGVHARRNLGNDGSLRAGLNAEIKRCVAESGHKHSILIGSGLVEDVVCWDVSREMQTTTSSPLVFFFDDAADQTITVRHIFILGNPTGADTFDKTSALEAHYGFSGGVYTDTLVEGVAIKDIEAGGGFVGSNSLVYRGIYLWNAKPMGYASGPNTDVFDCIMSRDAAGITGDNRFVRGQGSNFCSTSAGLGTGVTNKTGKVFQYGVIYRNGGAQIEGDNSFSTTVQNYVTAVLNATSSAGRNIDIHSDNYTGDHNVFYTGYLNGTRHLRARDQKTGSDYTTLAAWQAQTGQDANSVWLTTAQIANFFLGDPTAGDFRINPSASVTGADGTVYVGEFPDGTPITEAGEQYHWNWNSRSKVVGAPTAWPNIPGTLSEARQYAANPRGWNFYP